MVISAVKYDPAANVRDTATLKDYGFSFITPEFQLVKSDDKSKVVIYYVENQQTFHALAFDADSMKVLWDKTFSPQGMSFWEEFGQVLVDNEGTMRVILEKNRLRARKDDQHYEIYEVGAATSEPRTYSVGLEGKNAYDAFFRMII